MRWVRLTAGNDKYQNYAVIYFGLSKQNITEMRSYYTEINEYIK